MFSKVLIANRGEIACRILRTARRLGIETVAIFSEADCNAMHVKMADEAYLIGSAASKDSYLNINHIIAIAKQTQACAIHPGYGFLSENDQFAQACEQNNIIFIGPDARVIRKMGNKNIAKELMQQHGIPVLPGYFNAAHSLESLCTAANNIGFPIVLKATAGGGGKGLQIVQTEQEFEQAYFAVKREAKAFFNNEEILLEKYMINARHVEVQILADHTGYILPLFTRDCSIQRRQQKILEEAPAPHISTGLQDKMIAASITAAQSIHYTNAGTIEFLVEQEHFYFMEMNTRLQVEHPVTEMITGLDLIEWQFRIAAGQELTKTPISCQGHALEVRLNAEDPEQDFLPSIGKLEFLQFPQMDQHARIDTGYQEGDEVTLYYDSLLAKIIVWAENRLLAIRRLEQMLNHTYLFGIKTNLPLLKRILQNESFKLASFNTSFLQQETCNLPALPSISVLGLGGIFRMLINQQVEKLYSNSISSPWQDLDGWQLFTQAELNFNFMHMQELVELRIKQHHKHYAISIKDTELNCHVTQFSRIRANVYALECIMDSRYLKAIAFFKAPNLEIIVLNRYVQLTLHEDNAMSNTQDHEERLLAPMSGRLVAFHVSCGQKVAKGDKLLVIEAMKMEHTLQAPRAGIVQECYYQVGDLVKEGAELLRFEVS